MAKGKSNRRCFFICNISENLGEQGSNRDHSKPRFLSCLAKSVLVAHYTPKGGRCKQLLTHPLIPYAAKTRLLRD